MRFRGPIHVITLLLWMSVPLRPARVLDPSRLLVATVVDGSNRQIVEDSHYLFRSIRLFGGTLNQAVLMACIVLEAGSVFSDDEVLRQYSEIGVQIDFIKQTPSPYPRTLNKFATFQKFDSNKFDYFLWLDADIVVFDDPLPQLPEFDAGSIYCVPEVYNYMKRFGAVNESQVLWNPSLPPFHLINELNPVSHGLCNTGVLLFDSISLSKFVSTLFRPNHLSLYTGYVDDRFIDSLAFVIGVNLEGIQVKPLHVKFNFMAFFELTLNAFGFDDPPLLIHFIHDTSLLFNVRAEGTCYSMYQCSHISSASDQRKSIVSQRILNFFGNGETGVHNCLVMARKLLPPNSSHSLRLYSIDKDVSGKQAFESLRILWPIRGSRLFVAQDMINVQVVVAHPVIDWCVENASICDFSAHFQSFVNGNVYHDGIKNAEKTTCEDLVSCVSLFSYAVYFDISTHESFDFEINAFTSGLDPVLANYTHFSVVFLGFREYDMNNKLSSRDHHLSDPMPISLSSQLNLATFLNMRRTVDVGVALCCDTIKGVEVVRRLIKDWGQQINHHDIVIKALPKGSIFLISVQSSPYEVENMNVNFLVQEFSSLCKGSSKYLGGCVVSLDPSTNTVFNTHRKYFRESYVSFVFIDIFISIMSYQQALIHWYSVLATNGVMLGTRYHTQEEVNKTLSLPSSLFIQNVVDNFSYSYAVPLFHTFAEKFFLYESAERAHFLERLPAWYMLKD